MSVAYKWVNWNPKKKLYDLVLAAACLGYVLLFVGLGLLLQPAADQAQALRLLIAATGTLATLLLHVVLSIGPLARFDQRWAALLYNRRHLGVTTFLAALAHAALVVLWYGAGGIDNPLVAVVAGRELFPLLGFLALLILFLLASTSHDFWLANLSPGVWKWLHMSVYAAYALLVGHVALGTLRDNPAWLYIALMAAGAAWLTAIHALAGQRERARDNTASIDNTGPDASAWTDIGAPADFPDDRGRVICLPNAERIAVFKHQGRLSAVTNVCAHQAGPLGEGRIIDGCITCPWHGYQYLPANGQSPPPFTEKIATYELRIRGGRVLVNPHPRPPGTPVEPAAIEPAPMHSADPKPAPKVQPEVAP